jgi:hypothetical protein
MINNNILPYFRKDTSALLVFSAAIALLLLASPLALSNVLLQPVQATTTLPTSMQTHNPVKLGRSCSTANATLTFEAKGNGQTLTNGTFQITDSNSGQILWSGDLYRAESLGEDILLVYGVDGNVPVCGIGSGDGLQIQTGCGVNIIEFSTDGGDFRQASAEVDCELPHHTTTAQQPSSSTSMTAGTTTTTQQDRDGDGDGIPDSSDKCTHNSNPRCFKEGGDTSGTTTTPEQQPSSTSPSSPSSSSSSGNQTR